MKNKIGLSTVVSILLMTLLVIVAFSIVWLVANGIIKGEIDNSESCFPLTTDKKVLIETKYTCYNKTSKEVQFSIDIRDVDIDELRVLVSGISGAESFVLNRTPSILPAIRPYTGTYDDLISLPEKNSGKTYFFNATHGEEVSPPISIEIVPIIDGNSCGIVDSLNPLEDCSVFVYS